jgi:two-component system sensor histidine kinase UhpB
MSLVKQTTATIRGLMADLRPPVLDDYGLGEALRWYAERFGIRTGIAVEVSEGGDERRLPSAVENALFRIAQEALTNVAKHAKTARATIRLDVEAQAVRLQVADEGGGFEPAITGGPDRDRGWGLVAMRERAEAVGGQCRIDSRPGGGTRVLVEVPR